MPVINSFTLSNFVGISTFTGLTGTKKFIIGLLGNSLVPLQSFRSLAIAHTITSVNPSIIFVVALNQNIIINL